jgi:Fur family ferric uptake transcriptional regulator
MIIDIIHEKGEHLKAETIISCVQNKMPGVNKSTIYRTLDLLEQAGCVFKTETDDGTIFHHAEEGHHHHLVCQKCGKSIDCDEDLFGPVEKDIDAKYGYAVEFQHLVIKGLCGDCRRSGR